jgi:hypothetical protein
VKAKTVLQRAARVTVAGAIPAAMMATSQTAANATVTYNCGRNFSPSKATTTKTVERGFDKSISSYVSLREGTIDGQTSIYWARQEASQNTPSGWVDLDWYQVANNTTHYDCREYTGYSDGGYYHSRNYTQGVLYGWDSPPGAYADAFRPCMRWSSPGGTPGAIACGAWYEPGL